MRRGSSRVFRRADGLMRADFYSHPINFKDRRGHWQAIDNRLVPSAASGYALSNSANSYRLDLPNALGERPVRIKVAGDSVSFALAGATGGIERSATGAKFTDVLPGVTVEYVPGWASVKENLVLADQNAAHDFSFVVHPSRTVAPKLTRSGAVEFRDRDGKSRFAFAPPYMSDASGQGTNRRGDISFALEPLHRHRWKLSLRTSGKWLGDPDRRWPVAVDPTFVRDDNVFPARDCFIESGNPNASHCADTTVDAGSDGSGARRGLFKPNLDFYSTYGSIQILDATLNTFVSSQTGTPSSFSIYRLGREFDSSNVTWNSPWTTPGGDLAGGALDSKTIVGSGQNVSWHVPPVLVQNWYDKRDTLTGLLIKQDSENGSNMVHFRSEEACGGTCSAPLQFYFKRRSGNRSDLNYATQSLTDRLSIGVQLSSGYPLLSLRELSTAGKGFALGVNHYYDPLAKVGGVAGKDGWLTDTGTHVGLEKFGDGSVAFYAPSGSAYGFDPESPGSSTYRPAAGLHASLKRNVDQSFDLTFDVSGEIYHFDANGFLVSDKSRNNSGNTYGYTGANVTSITDSEGLVTTLTYDVSGRLSTIKHNLSNRTWTYGYGASNQLTTSTDPDGKTTTYTYNPTSLALEKITDPRGHDTKISYINKRVYQITRVTNAGAGTGPTTTFSYNDGDAFITCNEPNRDPTMHTVVTDPNGHVTTYCFDRLDRAWKVIDADGRKRSASYSPFGDVEQYTPATLATQGFNVSATFDSTTNVLKTLREQTGSGTQLAYDFEYASGKFNPQKVTDPQGNDTNIAYDASGNPETVSDAKGTVTVHHSGPGGQASDVVDGNGHTTTFTYGTAGNLKLITPPAPLGTTAITYDSSVRVKTVTDGKGQLRTYTYDSLDRIAKIDFSDGSSVSASYDPNGNLLSRTDTSSTGATQTTSYTYDDLNRLLTQTFPGGQTTTYGYDAVGNLASLQDAGGTVTYTHDPANLLTRMHEPGASNDYTFNYDDNGARSSTLFPNGVSVNTTNDGIGRPTRILARGPGGSPTLKDLRYVMTPASPSGDRTDTELTRQFQNGLNNYVTAYTYDARSRLTDALTTAGVGGSQVRRFSYTFDGANNRSTETKDLGSGASTTSYGYNNANEMTSAGSTTFTYDANGNETGSSAGQSFAYNAKDQTTAIGTLALSYLGPNQVELISDGAAFVANDVLGVASRGSEYYTRDDQGEVLAKRSGASNSWYLHDRIGSVVGLTDASGAGSGGYTYDPYGNPLGTAPNIPWGYAGGYAGPWGGLYHYGFRYYDPTIGRWTQQDPVMSPTDLQEANRYTYVGNEPLDRTDPSGLVGVPKFFTDIFEDVESGARSMWKFAITRYYPGVAGAYGAYYFSRWWPGAVGRWYNRNRRAFGPH